MKKFNNFILEDMNTSDFEFKTNLSHNEIYYTNHDDKYKYDDYEDLSAIVYWKLRFEWMGDEGIEYYIDVHKVELEYVVVIYNDEDIKEEKTLLIDDPEKIEINTNTPNNQQITVQEITVDGDNVEITF